MNKSIWTVVGFLLFITGFIAIVLSLVGLNLQILSPLENLGQGKAFLIKILLTLGGIVMIYLVRNDFSQD